MDNVTWCNKLVFFLGVNRRKAKKKIVIYAEKNYRSSDYFFSKHEFIAYPK